MFTSDKGAAVAAPYKSEFNLKIETNSARNFALFMDD